MKWKCTNCYEWSDVKPCDSCGAPIPDEAPPRTDEEKHEAVLDRLRGGPRERMKALASECEMDYKDLMRQLRNYVESDGNGVIALGVDTPYEDVPRMWDDYELITGTVVPESCRDTPFTCAC